MHGVGENKSKNTNITFKIVTSSYLGCFKDGNGGVRDLSGASYISWTNMTNQFCAIFCNNNSFIYFGLQFRYEKLKFNHIKLHI